MDGVTHKNAADVADHLAAQGAALAAVFAAGGSVGYVPVWLERSHDPSEPDGLVVLTFGAQTFALRAADFDALCRRHS